MFNVIQRVVPEELQLRDDAQLLSHTQAQFVAHLLLVVVDILKNLLRTFAGENAQVSPADAQIRADAAGAYTYQYTAHGAGLFLEYIAQFLLNEP